MNQKVISGLFAKRGCQQKTAQSLADHAVLILYVSLPDNPGFTFHFCGKNVVNPAKTNSAVSPKRSGIYAHSRQSADFFYQKIQLKCTAFRVKLRFFYGKTAHLTCLNFLFNALYLFGDSCSVEMLLKYKQMLF